MECRRTFRSPRAHRTLRRVFFSSQVPLLFPDILMVLHFQINHHLYQFIMDAKSALGNNLICQLIGLQLTQVKHSSAHLPQLSAGPGTRHVQSCCMQSRCKHHCLHPPDTQWSPSSGRRDAPSVCSHWFLAARHPPVKEE